MRRGEAYLEKKYFDKAIEDFEMIYSFTIEHEHERLKNIGLALLGKNEYERASETFIKSLKEYPACGHCWGSLLVSYEGYQPKDALRDLLSEEKFPEIEFTANVYYIRSRVFTEKEYSFGYEDLASAIKLEPAIRDSVEYSLNNAGLILSRNGQYEKAIQLFNAEVELQDFIHKYNIAIAMTLWKGHDAAYKEIQSAEEALLREKRENKDSAGVVTYGFAGIEAVKNNKNKALSLLKSALELDSTVYSYATFEDPAWNTIRSDLDFKEIIQQYEKR